MASCLPTRNAWTGVVAVLRWDLMPIWSPLIEKGLSVRCVIIPLKWVGLIFEEQSTP